MRAALLSLLSAIISLAQAAPRSEESTAMTVRTQASPETCGNIADLVPWFQIYDQAATVHYYSILDSDITASLLEGPNTYVFNGVAALIFPTPELSTVPFFRLVNAPATAWFWTTSANESSNAVANGYRAVDIAGYIYPTQVCGSVPLYRAHFIGGNADYLYTTSVAERDNAVAAQGFVDEGIAGYVMELASGVIIN